MTAESGTRATDDSYNGVAKLLHWLIAGMVVLQFVLASLAEEAEDHGSKFQELVLLANHKSVGITILALAIARLAWRFIRPPPPPLPMPAWQHTVSGIAHWSLYALLILMPLSGWLMSSASAISVSWFNVFQLPDFVPANEGLEDFFEDTHEFFATLLFSLALIHVGAAAKHAVIDRDGAIRRISSRLSLSLFVAVLVLGVFALTRIGRASETLPDKPVPQASTGSELPTNALPLWQIDYAGSFIRFTAVQAGADFDAEWQDWQADLRFDSARLDESAFDVMVTADSVETKDQERNQTLMDREWFDGENYPRIFYRATAFSMLPNGRFAANGEMQVKDVTSPVTLTFSIHQDGQRITLEGSARLDRLALGVGTGDWEDTTWVGQFVDVEVRVVATLRE